MDGSITLNLPLRNCCNMSSCIDLMKSLVPDVEVIHVTEGGTHVNDYIRVDCIAKIYGPEARSALEHAGHDLTSDWIFVPFAKRPLA
jgi:hypothetical protein